MLELVFSLIAAHPIPSDHGYLLFSAISQLVPEVHAENSLAVYPIRGRQIGNRQIELIDRSRLVLRIADGEITPLLKLAGQSLRVGATSIRVGVPQVRSLVPATALRSRLVTIKVKGISAKALTSEIFLEAARQIGRAHV